MAAASSTNSRIVQHLIDNGADIHALAKEEGEALAREYNVGFFETSAKEDINVDAAFMTLATSTMERLCKQDRPRNKGHQLDQQARGRGGGGGGKNCCG